MTLATESLVSGRKPCQFCVLRMDYCTREYGVSPCTAGVQSAESQGNTIAGTTQGGTLGQTPVVPGTVEMSLGGSAGDSVSVYVGEALYDSGAGNTNISVHNSGDMTGRTLSKVGSALNWTIDFNIFDSSESFAVVLGDATGDIGVSDSVLVSWPDGSFRPFDVTGVSYNAVEDDTALTLEADWSSYLSGGMIASLPYGPGDVSDSPHILAFVLSGDHSALSGTDVILQESAVFTAEDDGNGALVVKLDGVAGGSGAIDYDTGAWSANTVAEIGAGVAMTANYLQGPACFNTRKTCQDTPNYDAGVFEYRFVESVQDRGITDIVSSVGLEGSTEGIPSLRGVQIQPTTLNPGFGLSLRGRVNLSLQDHPHTDHGIDPYLSSRSYDPYTQGTFWRKFLARNPYYAGRLLKVYSGYITSPLSLDNFEVRTYQMENISGPDSSGRVQIVARDILGMIDSEKAVAPAASKGVLDADIDAVVTSATLSPAGVGDSEYPASGTVRIGSEVCTFTRSGDVLTIVRGTNGSEASTHSERDSVQLCLRYTARDIADVLYEILVTYAEVPASYIDLDDWREQTEELLSGHFVTALITEPVGVRDLVDEICRSFLMDVWWDEINSQVKLKVLAPPTTIPPSITDDDNILDGSCAIREKPDDRRSQVWVHYSQRDPTKRLDDGPNYRVVKVSVDANAESPVEYDESRITRVYSRWFTEATDALRLGERMLSRLRDTPREITFQADAKDLALAVGDNIDITSAAFNDFYGAAPRVRSRIIKQAWAMPGHTLDITAVDERYYDRYFIFTPDDAPDYDAATDVQKAGYGYISADSAPYFADGGEAYKFL